MTICSGSVAWTAGRSPTSTCVSTARGRAEPCSPPCAQVHRVRLPWRHTRISLIRSPHIDKIGMEQFERREYRTLLRAATNDAAELRRLLEALKAYQFTGVQVALQLTSAQSVELPPDVCQALGLSAQAGEAEPAAQATASSAAASGPGLLGAARVALPAPSPGPALGGAGGDALFEAALGDALALLREAVEAGLRVRGGGGCRPLRRPRVTWARLQACRPLSWPSCPVARAVPPAVPLCGVARRVAWRTWRACPSTRRGGRRARRRRGPRAQPPAAAVAAAAAAAAEPQGPRLRRRPGRRARRDIRRCCGVAWRSSWSCSSDW